MYYAGIDIGGTRVKMGVFDSEKNDFVHLDRRETPKDGPKATAALIGEMIRESGLPVAGVGAVSAGRVDPKKGTVIAGNLEWWNVPMGDYLREAVGVPVAMDNDVQGALYAEWRAGICRGMKDVVYVTIGTGIGGAFLINGYPWRGSDHSGAEVGHIVTHADGEDCACGGRGCWERYASAAALSRMAGGLDAAEVVRGVRAGDAALSDVFTRYIHELAIGVSSLVSVFRPELLVIGGGLSEAGDTLLAPLRYELETASPSIPRGPKANIALASLGNKAGILGAAMLAMDGR